MRTYSLLIACAFVVASAVADVPPPSVGSASQARQQTSESQSLSVKPVPQQLVQEPKLSPDTLATGQSLVVEPSTSQTASVAKPTDSAKLQASQETPLNPPPIATGDIVPAANSTSDSTKTLGGMTLGTVALIVICVLAVVVLSVGLLQYLLKSRRNRS